VGIATLGYLKKGEHVTIFEVVKIALDELYAEGSMLHGEKLDKRITKDLDYLSGHYRTLTDPSRQTVNYEDPARRFAYVYKYAAAHGDYLVQVLQKVAAKEGRIFDERVRAFHVWAAAQAATSSECSNT
jgi:hypothetical protein